MLFTAESCRLIDARGAVDVVEGQDEATFGGNSDDLAGDRWRHFLRLPLVVRDVAGSDADRGAEVCLRHTELLPDHVDVVHGGNVSSPKHRSQDLNTEVKDNYRVHTLDCTMDRRTRLLQLIRARFNGSQTEFARAIRRSRSQVSQWLNGHSNLGDGGCRIIEMALHLPSGYFDGVSDATSSSVEQASKAVAPSPAAQGPGDPFVIALMAKLARTADQLERDALEHHLLSEASRWLLERHDRVRQQGSAIGPKRTASQ